MTQFLPWIFMFVCFIVFCALGWRNKSLHEIQIKPRTKVNDYFIIILLGCVCICAFMLVQAASIEIFKYFGWYKEAVPLNITNFYDYLAVVVISAVLPAVMEEVVFRGVVLHSLKKYGKVLAVAVSAVLFSVYHMSPAQTVYQLILGIIFAVIVIKSGNLFLSMLLHFVNNFLVITYTFIAGNGGGGVIDWNAYTVITAVVLAAVGTAAVFSLLRQIKTSTQISVQGEGYGTKK